MLHLPVILSLDFRSFALIATIFVCIVFVYLANAVVCSAPVFFRSALPRILLIFYVLCTWALFAKPKCFSCSASTDVFVRPSLSHTTAIGLSFLPIIWILLLYLSDGGGAQRFTYILVSIPCFSQLICHIDFWLNVMYENSANGG